MKNSPGGPRAAPIGSEAGSYAPPALRAEETGSVGPLASTERLLLLDVLRGVAIMGVLLSYTLWNLGAPPSDTWSAADRAINVVAEILVDGKFLTIFAFLFGVGVAQQWRRVESHGRDPARVHLRRMLFLLLVGLLHGALLRNGDILAPYAILGIALLAFRRAPTRLIIVAVCVLVVVPNVAQVVMYWTGWSFPARPGAGGGNLDWLRYWYQTNPLLSWPRILALMLAGVLAARAHFLEAIAGNSGLARRIVLVALPLAVGGRALLMLLAASWNPEPALVKGIVLNLLYHVSAWSLAATYIGAFALLLQPARWAARLGWLGATGRMAFTNYLLQALIIVPICVAFGLFDKVSPVLGLTMAIGVAAVQLAVSVWWLRRFRYGPLEAVWRRVTYSGDARVVRAV